MTENRDRIEALIADLALVRDDELVNKVRSSSAGALLVRIVESPVPRRRSRRRGRPRRRVAALAVAITMAAILSIPAFGVGEEIISLFAGWHDPDAPVPTASDVLIASGEAGVPWKIVATRSDQGLCLGLFYRVGADSLGNASCGYRDIRGDLPPDLRGDPSTKCLVSPTAVAPCGSLPRHWIGPFGAGGRDGGLDRVFAFGPLAEGVASVDILLSDRKTLHAHVVKQPEGLPLNFYWAAWRADDAGPDVTMAVARDAAGRVLERRVPIWNGNPTGAPEGPPPPS